MTAPALFTAAKTSVSASLIGCVPSQQAKVTTIADYMVDGSFSEIEAGGNRVILGDELMKRLGAGLNQTLLVSVGTMAPTPFKVIGRYYTGNRMADMQAYGAIADVQKLKEAPNQVNEIAVRLYDYTDAASVASSWSAIAPERTESWDQQFANIVSVLKLQTSLRFAMIITILIVAGFGIYNILNMTVNQKRQDIAILRSMGFDQFDVVMLFFSQGLVIGICGAIAGLFVGYLLCLYLQTISFMETGPTGNTSSGHLRIALTYGIFIQASALAILTSSMASILPARAAGLLTPIDVIRKAGG